MPITSHGVIGRLGTALAAAQPGPQSLIRLATTIPSTLPAGSAEKLDFIGMPPKMREWLGKRQPKVLQEYLYSVTMKKFESTMQVPTDWAKNDKTGLVDQRIQQQQLRLLGWRAERIAARVNGGASENGFDGVTFFNASHSMGASGTFSNILTKTVAVNNLPTPAEAADGIMQAWARMMSFLDDAGEPMREDFSALAIVVPPAIAAAHLQAITQKQLDTGSGTIDNPLAGLTAMGVELVLIASARITTTGKATLVNISEGASPFVMFENADELSITAKAEGSDFEHDEDAWEFGVKSVGESGYGLPQDAVQVTYST